jgi:hypothetical protein
VTEMAKSRWPEVEEKLVQVAGWARNGLTDAQIAHNLGISVDTFYTYKKEHPEFAEALKVNKEIADLAVENALFKRANGYQYEEVTYERIETTVVEPDGSIHLEPGTKIKTVIKQQAPDVTAQIFWLKNRKPAEWRDKRDVGLDNADGLTINVRLTDNGND